MISSLLKTAFTALTNAGRAFSSLLSPREALETPAKNPHQVEKEFTNDIKKNSEMKQKIEGRHIDKIREEALRIEEEARKKAAELAETQDKQQKTKTIKPQPVEPTKMVDDTITPDEIDTLRKQRSSYEDDEKNMIEEAAALNISL